IGYTGNIVDLRIVDLRRDCKCFVTKIEKETEGQELPFTRDNFMNDLQSIVAALEIAGDAPTEEAFQNVMQELNGLLYYSRELEGALSAASRDIALGDMAIEVEEVTKIIEISPDVEQYDLKSA